MTIQNSADTFREKILEAFYKFLINSSSGSRPNATLPSLLMLARD